MGVIVGGMVVGVTVAVGASDKQAPAVTTIQNKISVRVTLVIFITSSSGDVVSAVPLRLSG